MITDICIDIETLDTQPSAVVLSFGAALLDDSGDIAKLGPERRLPVEEQLAVGRTMSWNTLSWWMAQGDTAQVRAFTASRVGPYQAMQEIASIEHMITDNTRVWARDPNFDCVILCNLFASMGWKLPGYLRRFYRWRSIRTIEDIAQAVGNYERQMPAVPHSALSDAMADMGNVAQARDIIGA